MRSVLALASSSLSSSSSSSSSCRVVVSHSKRYLTSNFVFRASKNNSSRSSSSSSSSSSISTISNCSNINTRQQQSQQKSQHQQQLLHTTISSCRTDKNILENKSSLLHCSSHRNFASTAADTTADAEIINTPQQQRKSDHDYCVELVQSRDKEGYLCGLLMPAFARESYFAVRAFNVELASVKDGGGLFGQRKREQSQQSDEVNGGDSNIASKLRMQWWRDAVAEIYEPPSSTPAKTKTGVVGGMMMLTTSMLSASRKRNPIVCALNRAVHESNLTKRFLDRMIDTRDLDLDIEQYTNFQDLIQYSEDTHSSLLYLNLECLQVSENVIVNTETDIVASNVGIGLGLLTAIRSTVHRASTMGEIPIPIDIMNKHNVPNRYLLNPPNITTEKGKEFHNQKDDKIADQALQNAVKEMAHVAANHLSRARIMQGQVPKEARLSLLPAVIGLNYLTKLEKANYDLYHPDLLTNDNFSSRLEHLGFTLLLGRTWLTGIF